MRACPLAYTTVASRREAVSLLWLYANVVLWLLTKDPPEMAECSARLMAQAERGEVSLYISLLANF